MHPDACTHCCRGKYLGCIPRWCTLSRLARSSPWVRHTCSALADRIRKPIYTCMANQSLQLHDTTLWVPPCTGPRGVEHQSSGITGVSQVEVRLVCVPKIRLTIGLESAYPWLMLPSCGTCLRSCRPLCRAVTSQLWATAPPAARLMGMQVLQDLAVPADETLTPSWATPHASPEG